MVGVQNPFSPIAIPGRLAYLTGGNAWSMETTTGNRRRSSPPGTWMARLQALPQERLAALHPQNNRRSPMKRSIRCGWSTSEEDAAPGQPQGQQRDPFCRLGTRKGPHHPLLHRRAACHGPRLAGQQRLLRSFVCRTGDVSTRTHPAPRRQCRRHLRLVGHGLCLVTRWRSLAYSRPDGIGLVDLETRELIPLIDILPYQTGGDWAWVTGWPGRPPATPVPGHPRAQARPGQRRSLARLRSVRL